MCSSIVVLNQTKNGMLTFCNRSKLFQLVFNNLCFEFYEWELNAFTSYVKSLDVGYWEKELQYWVHERKIPISVGQNHFIILVSKQEVYEIKNLLSTEKPEIDILHYKDINYRFIEN